MPLYDYACACCGTQVEKAAPIADRHGQTCDSCGSPLEMIFVPQPRYVPFHPYFDEGLGVHITGRDHRRRVMRDLSCDFRDHMSPGDRSVRRDRAETIRKARADRPPRPRT